MTKMLCGLEEAVEVFFEPTRKALRDTRPIEWTVRLVFSLSAERLLAQWVIGGFTEAR